MLSQKRRVRDSPGPSWTVQQALSNWKGLCLYEDVPPSFFTNPGESQKAYELQLVSAPFSPTPTPCPGLSPCCPPLAQRSTAKSLLQFPCRFAPSCPLGTPWQAGHLPWATQAEGARACRPSAFGKVMSRETNASRPSQPAPLHSGPGGGGHSLPSSRSQNGHPGCPGTWRAEHGAARRPATALPLCARVPAPAGSGAAPTSARTRALPALDSVPPLGCRGAASRPVRRAGCSGGGRREGRGRLYGAAAGRKEALVSQAGCIPARGAHLSGQEPERCRARPPEKAEAPGPAPRRTAAGQGRSLSFSLQSSPGRGAFPPLRAPGPGAVLPWAEGGLSAPGGIAVLPLQVLGSEPTQWLGAAPSSLLCPR